ncbi:MAG: polyisoprenoid-binding protein [Bacteroidia bacterium]|nr:polyisoprenoid-binding protein [Bacteroidia bacterium]
MSITKWSIDPSHSEIDFKVKHLMISTVSGKFTNFTASVETDNDDFNKAKVNFSAETDSITTGSDQRDGHLKSDDFFNVEQYPKLTFVSTGFDKKGDKGYTLTGDLTIRDITKSIVLDVEFNGLMTDPYGQQKAGFEVNGKINRKDFNLKWSATTEAGGIVVSDEVKIACNVQMTKQV